MYCQMGYNNLSMAIKTLSHCGLSLYLYLAKNKDGEIFPLSPVDVEHFTGMKGNTYSKAVKELITTGYLHKRAEGSNYYIFSVVPNLVADPAEVSPTFEGVADPADIESSIYKAVETVWLRMWPQYPEASPNKKDSHFVWRDDVENQLIKNGVEITPAVKQSLDNKRYIWSKSNDDSLPF